MRGWDNYCFRVTTNVIVQYSNCIRATSEGKVKIVYEGVN